MFFVDFTLADLMTLTGHGLVWFALWSTLHGSLELAMAALILAMLIDALDGKVARALDIARPFGRYMGSFVDLINYTVVPPLVLNRMGYDTWPCWVVMFGFSTSGMLRLSKFNEVGNLREGDELKYLGLPVFWIHFLLVGLYVLKSLCPGTFEVATTLGLGALAVGFLLDRAFWKPHSGLLILGVNLVMVTGFLWIGLGGSP